MTQGRASDWILPKDSYFRQVKEQHEKWVASHLLWIFWMQYLDHNQSKFKEDNDRQFYVIAEMFEKYFAE